MFFCHFACAAPFTLLFVYFTFSQPGTSSFVIKAIWSAGVVGKYSFT